MDDKIKNFLFRMKIFFWYLLTEPIRQFIDMFKFIGKILEIFDNTLTWGYISLLAMIVAYLFGKKFIAVAFLLFFLLVLLMWEWESGTFMNRFREHEKKRIEKVLKEKEPNIIKKDEMKEEKKDGN